MILSIIAVLFTFGLVIFIHELGHFLAAKWQGIRVDEFAFGFGPSIWKRKIGYTEYKLNWIPLGGYVKPAGEDITASSGNPWEYFAKPWYRRIIVVVAGPAMNYVLAFILFTGLILVMGDPTPSSKPILGEVMSTSPAETAGLKAGDVIKQIDGVPISKWEDIANSVQPRADKTIEVVALRAGVEEKFTLTPRLDKTRNVGVMGVTVSTEYKPVGVFESVRAGAYQCWFWTYFTLQTIGEKIYKREKPDVAGPVGIVQMVSSAAHSGIENLIMLIGLLSVAIGLFNLFPIPVLDGGHVVLFLWEGISRRKLTEKLVARANSVGMVILFSLLIFATYSDIARIRQGRKEKAAAAEKARAEQTVPAQAPASSPAPAK